MSDQPFAYHLREYARDVPKSCLCSWEWCPPRAAWMRTNARRGCVWHYSGRPLNRGGR